jgi:hypothetical protein
MQRSKLAYGHDVEALLPLRGHLILRHSQPYDTQLQTDPYHSKQRLIYNKQQMPLNPEKDNK